MALTFGRRRVEPTALPPRNLDIPMRGGPDATEPVDDDYLIEDDETSTRPSAMLQVVRLLQIVLVAILAVLSFAIFWLLGVMLNIL